MRWTAPLISCSHRRIPPSHPPAPEVTALRRGGRWTAGRAGRAWPSRNGIAAGTTATRVAAPRWLADEMLGRLARYLLSILELEAYPWVWLASLTGRGTLYLSVVPQCRRNRAALHRIELRLLFAQTK